MRTTLTLDQFTVLIQDYNAVANEASKGRAYSLDEALDQLGRLGVDPLVGSAILTSGGNKVLNAFLMGWYIRGRLEND